MYIVDKTVMARAEQLANDSGRDYFTLMTSAGTACAQFIAQDRQVRDKTVLILCGKGNNGGDGFVIAKELSLMGARVTVALTHGEPTGGIAKKAFDGMPKDVSVTDIKKVLNILKNKKFDIVIDAVFGTGYNGKKPDEELQSVFKAVPFVDYSIDLPSLIACDTGEGWQYAPYTKNTLTFAALKFCHILPHSTDKCGKVTVLDIGITEEMLKSAGAKVTEISKPVFNPRAKTSCKNNFGTALSVCGSYGMPGASVIAAKAALRSGVGVLKLACIKENYTACAASVPEAVLIPLNSQGTTYSATELCILKENLASADALLIGCGLGKSEDAKQIVRELLINSKVPVVLDADGINLIAESIELLKEIKVPLVLTPHPGEMARLCKTTSGEIESNRFKHAVDFAKEYGVYLVLKGTNTITVSNSGEISVNTIGNAGMATAGSGDMLAGIMLSLLAQGYSPNYAVKAAVWLHSAAGDAAKERLGEYAMLPTDTIEELHRFLP